MRIIFLLIVALTLVACGPACNRHNGLKYMTIQHCRMDGACMLSAEKMEWKLEFEQKCMVN